jgi:hypothetical protein
MRVVDIAEVGCSSHPEPTGTSVDGDASAVLARSGGSGGPPRHRASSRPRRRSRLTPGQDRPTAESAGWSLFDAVTSADTGLPPPQKATPEDSPHSNGRYRSRGWGRDSEGARGAMSGRPVRTSFALYLVLGPALGVGLALAAFTATKEVSEAVSGGPSATATASPSETPAPSAAPLQSSGPSGSIGTSPARPTPAPATSAPAQVATPVPTAAATLAPTASPTRTPSPTVAPTNSPTSTTAPATPTPTPVLTVPPLPTVSPPGLP